MMRIDFIARFSVLSREVYGIFFSQLHLYTPRLQKFNYLQWVFSRYDARLWCWLSETITRFNKPHASMTIDFYWLRKRKIPMPFGKCNWKLFVFSHPYTYILYDTHSRIKYPSKLYVGHARKSFRYIGGMREYYMQIGYMIMGIEQSHNHLFR